MATDDGKDQPSPHVRLRISPELKQQWLDYVDESHHSTLTDLIKESVNNSISGDWVLETDDGQDLPDDLAATLDSIDDRLNSMATQLDDTTVAGTDDGMGDLDEGELMHLAHQCHELVPVVQDSRHLLDLTPVVDLQLEVEERARLTGTAQDISAFVDEPEPEVRKALIYLERQATTRVESFIDDGTRRWYDVDPTAPRGPPDDIELPDGADTEWTSAADMDENRAWNEKRGWGNE